VLAMVNQKLALSSGAQPCSTISFVPLQPQEGVVSKETKSRPAAVADESTMALAHPTMPTSRPSDASLALKRSLTTPTNTGSANSPDMTFPANSWAAIRKRLFPPSWVALARCARSAKASP
jgi:hypothetical protein